MMGCLVTPAVAIPPVPAEISVRQKRLEPLRVQRVRSDVCGVFWGPSSGR